MRELLLVLLARCSLTDFLGTWEPKALAGGGPKTLGGRFDESLAELRGTIALPAVIELFNKACRLAVPFIVLLKRARLLLGDSAGCAKFELGKDFCL